MADSYRARSRRSETPSSSSSGGSHHSSPSQYYHSAGPSNLSYVPANPGHPSYYPAGPPSDQRGMPSPYGHYAASSPPQSDGHHRRPSSRLAPTSVAPRQASYPGPVAPEFTSERASKRHRASTTPDQSQMQVQWADPSAHGYHQSATGRGSRQSERGSSGSSGYNSPPGYSSGNPHDPYGQQLFHSPSLVPGHSTMQGQVYHSRRPSSDDEYVEHGPTELPPRTYTGKSQYDPPKKPGKIPGSAMDYLPILEARFERLETAIDKYVDYRSKKALSNSILPGMDSTDVTTGRENYSSSSRDSRGSTRR